MSWPSAVKEWNKHQIFHNDLYAMPKKGSDEYDEVIDLMRKGKTSKSVQPKKEDEAPPPSKKEGEGVKIDSKISNPPVEKKMGLTDGKEIQAILDRIKPLPPFDIKDDETAKEYERISGDFHATPSGKLIRDIANTETAIRNNESDIRSQKRRLGVLGHTEEQKRVQEITKKAIEDGIKRRPELKKRLQDLIQKIGGQDRLELLQKIDSNVRVHKYPSFDLSLL